MVVGVVRDGVERGRQCEAAYRAERRERGRRPNLGGFNRRSVYGVFPCIKYISNIAGNKRWNAFGMSNNITSTTALVEIVLLIQYQINSGVQESFVDTLDQVMSSEVRVLVSSFLTEFCRLRPRFSSSSCSNQTLVVRCV